MSNEKLSGATRRRDEPGEPLEVRRDRARRPRFHGAVAAQDFLSQPGDARAAASASSGQRFDQRQAKGAVDGFDEQPGAPVRHFHLARSRRDRSRAGDGGEQIGFARAGGDYGADQDAYFGRESYRFYSMAGQIGRFSYWVGSSGSMHA